MLAPKNHLRLKLSTLCSRALGLFDELTDSNCRYWVDNLHMSANYLVHFLKHKAHVMIEGA